MEKNPYIELAECLLPEEMVDYFDVANVEKTKETLDVTLEERDNGEHKDVIRYLFDYLPRIVNCKTINELKSIFPQGGDEI